jgi:predicted transcriptional regulator
MVTSSSADVGRKLTRASTVSKTVETVKRQRERALKAKRMLKKKLAQVSAENSFGKKLSVFSGRNQIQKL